MFLMLIYLINVIYLSLVYLKCWLIDPVNSERGEGKIYGNFLPGGLKFSTCAPVQNSIF